MDEPRDHPTSNRPADMGPWTVAAPPVEPYPTIDGIVWGFISPETGDFVGVTEGGMRERWGSGPHPDPVAGLREVVIEHIARAELQLQQARAALLDSPKPDGRREPGTYRTAEGGIEVIVGIEESASFVEDQFPDEVEYIVAARLRERET